MDLLHSAAHFIWSRKTSSISLASSSLMNVFRAMVSDNSDNGSSISVGGFMSWSSFSDSLASVTIMSKSFCGNRPETV
ncbi:hypothetical protein DPMN_041936 [Dreissena polymorpha]|uniref:Uncharacterized protein n=1 Tax=Dreissena polymorpha TaxID=45954 RepID=A0A9D4D071_DREPO|nr:hypothetical protein DPMN_041936 [Dreissena polymorpha]